MADILQYTDSLRKVNMFFRKAKRIKELEREVEILEATVNRRDLELSIKQSRDNSYLSGMLELRLSLNKTEKLLEDSNKAIEGLKARLKEDKRYHALYDLAVKRGKKLVTELNQAKNALINYRRGLANLGDKMNYQELKIDGVLKK